MPRKRTVRERGVSPWHDLKRRIKRVCWECDGEFSVTAASEALKLRTQFYCSEACQEKAYNRRRI